MIIMYSSVRRVTILRSICFPPIPIRQTSSTIRISTEHWMANRVASYSVDGEFGIFDITMTQIGIGDVVPAANMGILGSVDGDIEIGVVYEVDATFASKGFPQTDKFFTELTEAIDYYNKVKAFFKAEIKPC